VRLRNLTTPCADRARDHATTCSTGPATGDSGPSIRAAASCCRDRLLEGPAAARRVARRSVGAGGRRVDRKVESNAARPIARRQRPPLGLCRHCARRWPLVRHLPLPTFPLFRRLCIEHTPVPMTCVVAHSHCQRQPPCIRILYSSVMVFTCLSCPPRRLLRPGPPRAPHQRTCLGL